MNNDWLKPTDMSHVIAKLQSDEAFKSRLLSDANSALSGIGIQVPKGLTVKVHENTESTLNFILPPPMNVELNDSLLETVAGGVIATKHPNKGG